MLANLEVKWLYDVIALEESRSFTLAAKARNISQSSFKIGRASCRERV